MDWGDEEEVKVTPRDIWDEETPRLKREKSKEGEPPKSAVKNKFADIMAKSPSPPPSPKVILVKGAKVYRIFIGLKLRGKN